MNLTLTTYKSLFKALLVLSFSFTVNNGVCQVLKLSELLSYPSFEIDEVETSLKAKGWESYNYEVVTDSNLIKKTWVINNKYNDLKSYFQYYEFTKNKLENYISYQFSERKAFNDYQVELKKMGYKDLLEKYKKKKKKKGDPNIYKERNELYFSERKNSLIVLKEVFVYGMNAFVFYTYKGDSQSAKDIIAVECK
ncbi:MAG: hypothetical protein JWO32_3 [Bacteroidetes bacterium]|nr:hypothetical protein [Bacteroidota bacterium]